MISLDSEQPHKVAPLRYDGPDKAILSAKRWLHYETGFCGQQIADWAAPADLKTAMAKPGAKIFAPVLVEEQMSMKKALSTDSEG